MCGIVGYVSEKWGETELKRGAETLRRRGPDDAGEYYFENVGLAHRRLAIIDLDPRARQPMVSHNGRYVMVFNGEIYNYATIAARLNKNWRTTSDTEVLLEAIAEWGAVAAVEATNGMFAFALLDKLERRLWLFRDRMGVKPITYYWDGQNFIFASELKALLAFGISRNLRTEAVADYLMFEYVPGKNLIFEHTYRLAAGEYLTLDLSSKSLKTKQYYELLSKARPVPVSENLALEKLTAGLTSACELQKVADVPLGAFLSGGTDSSAVVAASSPPPQTFTIGFDAAGYDESVYAARVAEKLGAPNAQTRLRQDDALALLDTFVERYDLPFAVSSALPTLLVCREARKRVTVALGGDGGDELFMGYGYYFWYDRIARLRRIAGVWSVKGATELLKHGNLRARRAARVMEAGAETPFWPGVWAQEQYMFNEKEISDLLGAPYFHRTLAQDWAEIERLNLHPYEKISLFDLKHYLPDNLLYKVDIASMSYGLEARVPLLDHELVETVLSFPHTLKIKDGEQKYLLKKYLEKKLPTELIYRKKWGFPAPIDKWLRAELSYLIDETLSPAAVKKRGLLNPKAVDNLVRAFRGGETYHYKRIWALVVFELWARRYLS